MGSSVHKRSRAVKTMKEKKKIITAKQFATMGGNTTLKKYGKEHFRKIAQMRWAKSKS